MFFESVTQCLQRLPVLGMEGLSLLLYFLCILLLYFFFGKAGLYTFIAVAIIGANLQVLKIVTYPFFSHPVALGTVLFSATFLCTDILSEYEGHRAAQKGVLLGFAAMLLWVIVLTLTVGYRPLEMGAMGGLEDQGFVHERIGTLYRSTPSLFLAGMSAYLVSQFHDILLYGILKKRHEGRLLWLRNNLSTMLSALIDNTVFSFLAWIVLAENPLAVSVVVKTYILGSYGIRVVVALLDTPLLYLMGYICKWRQKYMLRY